MKTCKTGCGGKMKSGGAVKKLTKAQKGISVDEKNPDKLVKEKGGKDPAIGSAAYRKLFNSKQAMDSANYYRNKAASLSKIPTSSKDFDKVIKNNSDLQRQYDKGKPGYDDMGNKKDAQGRPSSSKWYGYDPKAKKYIMGPNKGKTQAEVMKSSGTKKMAEGGSTGLVGMPRYSNNPRSEQGRILKKGGSTTAVTNRKVSPGCFGGKVKDANGKCVNERPKFKSGGSLKPVNKSANPGLAKLPTAVRNKMGYMKKGGVKKK
jgi:hypothetical protein